VANAAATMSNLHHQDETIDNDTCEINISIPFLTYRLFHRKSGEKATSLKRSLRISAKDWVFDTGRNGQPAIRDGLFCSFSFVAQEGLIWQLLRGGKTFVSRTPALDIIHEGCKKSSSTTPEVFAKHLASMKSLKYFFNT
jgi:hypothetical protein